MESNVLAIRADASGEMGIVRQRWHPTARVMLSVKKPRMNLWVGSPGTGKTTSANHLTMELTGQPPELLAGSPNTEPIHLWGHLELAGDRTPFRDGPLPSALKGGRWLLIEDFSLIPLEVRADLLPLRDQEMIINPVTKEILRIPPAFRCICTSNSESLTCRKNAGIADVLFDGFQILEVPELDEADVGSFLKHEFPQGKKRQLARVLKLWKEYREITCNESSAKSHLSYRAAANLMALLEKGLDEVEAVQIALVNRFLPTDQDLFSAAKLKNSLGGQSSEGQSEPKCEW